MKKKIVTLALSSALLYGCGTSKPASDDCCQPKIEQHQEKALNGLLFGLITYAIFSVVKL